MKNIFEALEKHFDNLTQNEFQKNWGKIEENSMIGPTVEEYLSNVKFELISTNEYSSYESDNITNNFNPKYTSDFFLTSCI